EQEARRLAEEARRCAEEAERREVEARLAATRLAELEKVRIEAEQRQRIALLEQANDHERRLAALQQDEQKNRLKKILVIGGSFAGIVLAAGFSMYFGLIKPEAERMHQQELADVATSQAELRQLRANYEATVDKSRRAAEELAQARDANDRIRATQAT